MNSYLAARIFVTTSSESVIRALCAAATAAERVVSRVPAAPKQFEREGECNLLQEKVRGAKIISVDNDSAYCRTGITLVCVANQTNGEQALVSAVTNISRVACDLLDLNKQGNQGHVAHPRLGIVDHVAVHPLPGGNVSNLERAADIATQIAHSTAEQCSLPVYLYGAADPQSKTLPELRRSMGYFQRDQSQTFAPLAEGYSGEVDGLSRLTRDSNRWPSPDFGPRIPSTTKGVSCIGALDWVVNINIPIPTNDMKIAQIITSRVRQLEGVQALPLRHGDTSIEIACNVHRSRETTASLQIIEKVVSEAAGELGIISVGCAYVVGLGPEDAYERASAALLAM